MYCIKLKLHKYFSRVIWSVNQIVLLNVFLSDFVEITSYVYTKSNYSFQSRWIVASRIFTSISKNNCQRASRAKTVGLRGGQLNATRSICVGRKILDCDSVKSAMETGDVGKFFFFRWHLAKLQLVVKYIIIIYHAFSAFTSQEMMGF